MKSEVFTRWARQKVRPMQDTRLGGRPPAFDAFVIDPRFEPW